MKLVQLVVSISLSLVFVISTVTVLFSSGRMLNAVMDAYVFKVDNCYGGQRAVPLMEEGEEKLQDLKCEVDYNQAKRDISGGISLLVFATPLAYFTFRKSQALLKEGRA